MIKNLHYLIHNLDLQAFIFLGVLLKNKSLDQAIDFAGIGSGSQPSISPTPTNQSAVGVAPNVVMSGLSMLHIGGGGGAWAGQAHRLVNQFYRPVVFTSNLESAPLCQKSGTFGQALKGLY